jgi:AcrR family transcriptional regulator
MDKQKKILQSALQLFVEYGFHGTPTSKIASNAGVAAGTLFHYFKTKDDLIVSLYIRIKGELNTYVYSQINPNDPIQAKFRTLFNHTLYWALENNQEFYFIQQFHFSPHLASIPPEELASQAKPHIELFEQAALEKVLKPFPADLLLTLVASQVYGLHQYLAKAGFDKKRQSEVIDQAFEMIWDMITV